MREEVINAMTDMTNTLAPLQTALTSSITPGQIVAVLAGIIGVGMTFVLMWFGAKKLIYVFRNAVFWGTISDLRHSSFSGSDGNEAREVYKQLLKWEHEKGVRHYDDDDFI